MDAKSELVSYYLKNGESISVPYSSGSNVFDLVCAVVEQYAQYVPNSAMPPSIFLRPDIEDLLRKQVCTYSTSDSGSFVGHQTLYLATACCTVVVIRHWHLPWPVFYGSVEELEQNYQNVIFERAILRE